MPDGYKDSDISHVDVL